MGRYEAHIVSSFNSESAVSQNVFLVCRRCNTNQMNSVTIINPLSYSSSHSFPRYSNHTCNFSKSPRNSFSTKRRRSRSSRRHKITPTDSPSYIKRSSLLSSNDSDTDANLKLVLDVNSITYRFNHFVSLSEDAYCDLQTLISLDDDNRIVVSCRKSTLQFTGAVLLGGFVLVSLIKVFVKLGLGFRSWIFRVNNRGDSVVVRRDRSLGGKEVVVARRDEEVVKKPQYGTSLDNLISLGSGLGRDDWRSYRVKHASKLPKWWPVLLTTAGEGMALVDKQEYQRDANRLVRGWCCSILLFAMLAFVIRSLGLFMLVTQGLGDNMVTAGAAWLYLNCTLVFDNLVAIELRTSSIRTTIIHLLVVILISRGMDKTM